MRMQTFKERLHQRFVTESTSRSKLDGISSFITIDEIKDTLVGNLIMMKAHPSDVESRNNINTLKNLFIIRDVTLPFFNEEYHVEYIVEPIFKSYWEGDPRTPHVLSLKNSRLLTASIFKETWFIGSMIYNVMKGEIRTDENGVVFKVNKKNVIEQLSILHEDMSYLKRTRHLFLIPISTEDVCSINTHKTEIMTKYNNVIIYDKGTNTPLHITKAIELTTRNNDIDSFLYRNF